MISKKTKYAINALVYLAKQDNNNPIRISDISESQNIPQKFLEAILLDLKKAGILASKKGKGGGYYMLKAPKEINLAEVMRLFDGAIALLPCVTYNYYERCEECIDEETCGIRDVFYEVRNKTVELLKKADLEQIIKREGNLKNII
ncbi:MULTISPECIES: RrF2 family transcriptional regulator [Psychroflexus]|uniref:Rrf2 family protein n=1 Tax=Psychroflexus halocasei TaxID=908615 RepID=A0A1H3ZAV1_9FLAO|nr:MULTISPECIES: Rrf2 family transcriptional regulator [Psychroflexus]PJX23658.1 transcriptional regulator [Psychroflexus sp. S27]SEA20903.1 Rrf2 family protein [Psychroflexus halocasei]